MNRALDAILPVVAVFFSIGGIAGFAYLFLRELNVFWLVVAPVIFAVYQIPAAVVWWWWKQRKRAARESEEEAGPGRTPDPGA